MTTDERADESNVQVEFNASRAGENIQTNGSGIRTYDRIQNSDRPDFQKEAMEEEQYRRTYHWTSEAAEIDTNITIDSKMNLDRGFL